MKFDERLKSKREAMGLTQSELAKRTGISCRMIQKYEAGLSRPRLDVAEKISSALEVPIQDLLGHSGMLVAEAYEKGGAKSAREISEIVDEVTGLFAGGTLPQEDKDAIMEAFTKAYFKSKEINKKYTPKKYLK